MKKKIAEKTRRAILASFLWGYSMDFLATLRQCETKEIEDIIREAINEGGGK